MKGTATLAVIGLLLLPTGGIQGQDWDEDWEERLEEKLERLGHRLERIGQAVDRAVSRSLARALERGVEIRWDHHGDGVWDHDAGPYRSQETFSWEGALSPGQTVEVKGVNGPILAEPAPGDRAEVVAEKRGRRDDPEEVRIEVLEHARGITVCAVYPPRRRRRENRCGTGKEGHISSHDNDVRVTFRIKVPRGVHFSGRTVNGDVEIRDLTADASAYTVNGSVELSTQGQAEARTVNGSIEARFQRVARDVDFETVNGSIELDVPDHVDAEIDAHWLNGGIESDLPLTIRGRLSKRRARGTLGNGGPLIALKTVNGSIRIR